jgi:hypothetical protein
VTVIGDHGKVSEREKRQLDRRREVLDLPMVAVRRHAVLRPSPEDPWWHRSPRAVGIGPEGEALALWDHQAADVRLLSRHRPGSAAGEGTLLKGARPASFVQPLPDYQVVLVDARSRGGSRGGETAEVRDGAGDWIRGGHLGDAVEHVLATPRGRSWVGYFEAAACGRGLGGHGLVRFGPDLQPDWRYPLDANLPRIDDCEALNVSGETAHASVYNADHLVRVSGETATDLGETLRPGAGALLIDGDRAAMIGGYGAEYDLVTPVNIRPDGVHVAGPQTRLVFPDGMELRDARLTCRGPELHVTSRASWYRADLADLHPGTR